MSAQVEEMAAQAHALANTAEQLKQLVTRFKLDDHVAPSAAAGLRQPGARTGTLLRRAA
jgi:hypothetical protein